MTNKTYIFYLLVWLTIFLVGCSQEKNTFINRSYHNTTSKYNGYYNAREKVKEGKKKLEAAHKENYKKLLPIFIYGDENTSKSVYPEMDAAIEKCSRVIEMHSMDIKGKEYCKWIDNSFMIIGQAHFYKQEYDEAKKVFDFVAKEYKKEPIRFEAFLWMVRSYTEKKRFYEADRVLNVIKNERGFPAELLGEQALVTADYYIKQEKYDLAIPELKMAISQTKNKKLKTRLMFILAQLYQLDGQSNLAIGFYKEVVKRHPPYEMEFYAKINLATAFNARDGNSGELLEILSKMLKDDKNIEYFDQIYYAIAEIHLKNADKELGVENLLLSVKSSINNNEQKGLSFYKLAQLSFEELSYEIAQKYYDSTATYLNAEHPDYDQILRTQASLNELVKNIKIIKEEDSLQKLASLSEEELDDLIFKVIRAYEEEEEKKERDLESGGNLDPNQSLYNQMPDDGNGKWYFYNPAAISFGYSEFKRVWGNRPNEDNWRRINKKSVGFVDDFGDDSDMADSTKINDKKNPDYYKQNIPFKPEQLEASYKKQKKAYYDLGVVYKEQLEDEKKSIETLEILIEKYDSSDYHLISYYRLYRMHLDLGNNIKATYYKNLILENYPESEYAKIILDPDYLEKQKSEKEALTKYYEKTYNYFKDGFYKACVMNCDESETLFPNNELKTKFLLLKAFATGKMGMKEVYLREIESLAKNHTATPEGKEAQEILNYIKKSEEEAKKRAEEEERLKKGYAESFNSRHTAALIVPAIEMDIEKVKISISNFNKQYFSLSDLKINVALLDKNRQLVSIQNFATSKEALNYYKTFMLNQTYLKEINEAKLPFFVISFDNYPIFYEKKNTDEYMEFFNKNYLKEQP